MTSRNPRLTKTQQLRQQRSAGIMKDFEKKQEERTRQEADPFGRKRKIVRPEPKKVDFSKPTMTKTMMARVKQAQKFKEEYARKQEALTRPPKPKRTAAPIGGDARMGRERIPDRGRSVTRPRELTPPPRPRELSPPPRPARVPSPPKPPVSKKTNELAKMMNADIIQAEPIGEGPINNVVIPPGVVNENRTTIVSIPQPPTDEVPAAAQIANRSIQMISETLNEQDALETSAVQSKLADLQQARRDFVITAASVGANAVNIDDESPPSFLSDSLPPIPQRQLTRMRDLEDEFIQVEHTRDYPDVVAAHTYMEQKEAERRIEEEFEKIAAEEQPPEDLLQLDVPFEEEIFQDRDISWEEDEAGMAIPRTSRVKAYVPPIPKQQKSYQYEQFDPEALERFFDTQRYPPCPRCGPPPGRERLHPDLWEMDDPWYIPAPEPGADLMEFSGPDLIEFSAPDLIEFSRSDPREVFKSSPRGLSPSEIAEFSRLDYN